MRRSLVLGVNGQDGSYLAEAMLRRGYEVVGVGTSAQSRYVPASARYRYLVCDLRRPDDLAAHLQEIQPDYAFHFAAVHGAAGFQYEAVWRHMMAVNVGTLHLLLEHARVFQPDMRVLYANSRKIFPEPLKGVIDETTAARATCLYGIGKIAARDLILYYGVHHRVRGTNLILFNHESRRRSSEYFLPTIVRALRRSQQDPNHLTTVRTLDFMMDWSDAVELMDIVVDIAEKSDVPELILASGVTWHARAAVERLFKRQGLDIRKHVVESLAPSSSAPRFEVSLVRLAQEIARRPVRTLDDIVDDMTAELDIESVHSA